MARGTPVRFADFITARWGPAPAFLNIMQAVQGELRWGYDVSNGNCEIRVHGVEHAHGSTSGFTRKIGAGVGIGVAPFGFRVSATTTVRFWIDWTFEVDPQELYVRCEDEPGCRKVVKVDIYRDYRVRSLSDAVFIIVDAGIGHSHRITSRLGTVYLPTPCAKPCCPPEGADIEFVGLADIPNDLPERPEENLPGHGVEIPWEIPAGPDPFDFETEGEGH